MKEILLEVFGEGRREGEEEERGKRIYLPHKFKAVPSMTARSM